MAYAEEDDGTSVTSLLKHIVKGKELEAFSLGCVGSYYAYRMYVPWRHCYVPYTREQFAWRSGLLWLGAPSMPFAAKRTLLATAVGSWVGDRMRHGMKKHP
jgi:hypothetical protein